MIKQSIKRAVSSFAALAFIFSQVTPFGFASSTAQIEVAQPQQAPIVAYNPNAPQTGQVTQQAPSPYDSFMMVDPLDAPVEEVKPEAVMHTLPELVEKAKQIVRDYLKNPALELAVKDSKNLPFSNYAAEFNADAPALPSEMSKGTLTFENGKTSYELEIFSGELRLTGMRRLDDAGNTVEKTILSYDNTTGKKISTYHILVAFDDQKRAIQIDSEYHYDANPRQDTAYSSTFTYNQWGQTSYKTLSKRFDGSVYSDDRGETLYDGQGRLLQSETKVNYINEAGKITATSRSFYINKYSATGKILLTDTLYESYDLSSGAQILKYKSQSTQTYKYNAQDNLLEDRRVFNNSQNVSFIYTRQLTYDASGKNAVREIKGQETNGKIAIDNEIVRVFHPTAGILTREANRVISSGVVTYEVVKEFAYAKGLDKKITQEKTSYFYNGAMTEQEIKNWIYDDQQRETLESTSYYQNGVMYKQIQVSSSYNDAISKTSPANVTRMQRFYTSGVETTRDTVGTTYNAAGQLQTQYQYLYNLVQDPKDATKKILAITSTDALTYTNGHLASRIYNMLDNGVSTHSNVKNYDIRFSRTDSPFSTSIISMPIVMDSYIPVYQSAEAGLLKETIRSYAKNSAGTMWLAAMHTTAYVLDDAGNRKEEKVDVINYHENGKQANWDSRRSLVLPNQSYLNYYSYSPASNSRKLLEHTAETYDTNGVKLTSMKQINIYDANGMLAQTVTVQNGTTYKDIYLFDSFGMLSSVKRTVTNSAKKIILEDERTFEYQQKKSGDMITDIPRVAMAPVAQSMVVWMPSGPTSIIRTMKVNIKRNNADGTFKDQLQATLDLSRGSSADVPVTLTYNTPNAEVTTSTKVKFENYQTWTGDKLVDLLKPEIAVQALSSDAEGMPITLTGPAIAVVQNEDPIAGLLDSGRAFQLTDYTGIVLKPLIFGAPGSTVDYSNAVRDANGNIVSGYITVTTNWPNSTAKKSVAVTTFAGGRPSFSKVTNHYPDGFAENYQEIDFSMVTFNNKNEIISGTMKAVTWRDSYKQRKENETETVFNAGKTVLLKTKNYFYDGVTPADYTETDFSAAIFAADGKVISGTVRSTVWADSSKTRKFYDDEVVSASGRVTFVRVNTYQPDGVSVQDFAELDLRSSTYDAQGNLSGKIKVSIWTDSSRTKKINEEETFYTSNKRTLVRHTDYEADGVTVASYRETNFSAAVEDLSGNITSGKVVISVWKDATKQQKLLGTELVFADAKLSSKKVIQYLSDGKTVFETSTTVYTNALFDQRGRIISGYITMTTNTPAGVRKTSGRVDFEMGIAVKMAQTRYESNGTKVIDTVTTQYQNAVFRDGLPFSGYIIVETAGANGKKTASSRVDYQDGHLLTIAVSSFDAAGVNVLETVTTDYGNVSYDAAGQISSGYITVKTSGPNGKLKTSARVDYQSGNPLLSRTGIFLADGVTLMETRVTDFSGVGFDGNGRAVMGFSTTEVLRADGTKKSSIRLDIQNGNPAIKTTKTFSKDGITLLSTATASYTNAVFDDKGNITAGSVTVASVGKDGRKQSDETITYVNGKWATRTIVLYATDGVTVLFKVTIKNI